MAKIEGFNYDSIDDKKIRAVARQNAERIRELMTVESASAVEIGKRLLEMKDKLGIQSFDAWREAELRLARDTVNRYIQAAKRFGDVDCLDRIGSHAMRALSRDKVPDTAVSEAISLARSGQVITLPLAKEICHRHGTTEAPRPHIQRVEIGAPSDFTSLKESLDSIASALESVARTMTRDDRERLADRFLELALQLRHASVEEAETLSA